MSSKYFIIQNENTDIIDLIIPDEITKLDDPSEPVPFLGFDKPFKLTLSPNMECSFGELLSENITILNIPAGTNFICSDCAPKNTSFFKCLEEINVDSENKSCASFHGILLSKDMKTLYACPPAYKNPVVVIPDTVTQIAPCAFYGCKQIKEIIIPNSVVEIGERAFADCKTLNKLVIPESVKKIGKEAFLRCSKLLTAGPVNSSDMETPKGKKKNKGYHFEFPWTSEIPENAFYGMRNLKKVVLPDSIKKIGKNAFKDCKNLEEINLPKDIQCTATTFKDCKKLSL